MSAVPAGRKSLIRWSSHRSFRPVDEWKSALMTLPDSSFFELLRSVFGNIKTPFSKQRLLDDLFVFLSRGEIRKIIAAYINEKDHKVIAAVALLNGPAPADMESFFAGEFSDAELHSVLINLEERLILYRYRDEGVLRLALNPVLEQVLAPFIADTRLLFPGSPKGSGVPKKGASPSVCIPDGRIMAALFTFLSNEEELFKAEGGIRKKVLDEGKQFFPALDLGLSIKILLLLGLFRRGTLSDRYPSESHDFIPCKERIAEYGNLSSMERQVYWTAGLYFCLNEAGQDSGGSSGSQGSSIAPDATTDTSAVDNAAGHNEGFTEEFSSTGIFSRSKLRALALFIFRYRNFIDPGRQYPEITLRRLFELLRREDEWSLSFNVYDSKNQLSFELILAAMEKTGILEKTGNCWKAGPGLTVTAKNDSSRGEGKPVIVMDAAFSIILYPEISFADALALGVFCAVKEKAKGESQLTGPVGKEETAVCFELTRQSVIHGFDQGMNADSMIKLLRQLSLNRIDESLGWTLREWESRYEGVSLYQGIVLTLAEDRRYLAEVKPVASLIQQTLAPGVYVLSSGNRSEAVRALRKAGVDIIAKPPSAAASGGSARTPAALNRASGSFPSLGSHDKTVAWYGAAEDVPESCDSRQNSPEPAMETEDTPEESGAIQENFFRVLEKMRLTKAERDELTARIDRRLVLSEAQLDKSSLRYEKLEARGLDYSGKLAIAKQAVDSGSLVEISWPCPEGGVSRTVGIVQGMEKKEGESILILKSFSNIPGNAVRVSGNIIRIPLGKISLLRRIKRSIFGE